MSHRVRAYTNANTHMHHDANATLRTADTTDCRVLFHCGPMPGCADGLHVMNYCVLLLWLACMAQALLLMSQCDNMIDVLSVRHVSNNV